jgi:hypothetical protein
MVLTPSLCSERIKASAPVITSFAIYLIYKNDKRTGISVKEIPKFSQNNSNYLFYFSALKINR